jgi:hypothetical protein
MAAGFSIVFQAFLIALVPAIVVGLGSYTIFRRWPHLGERRQK